MSHLLRDLVFALRQWRRYPLSNLTAILILVIGIGANTANFSLINALLLRPLPFPDSDRLAHLYLTDPQGSFDVGSFSMPTFLDLREKSSAFENLGAYYYAGRSLSGSDRSPERVTLGTLSVDMLPLLGVEPLMGRGFRAEEAEEGQNLVVLLAEDLWRTRFGGDPGILGQIVKLDGVEYTVIGVMADDFTFPFGAVKIWRPMVLGYDLHPRTTHFLQPVGRLRAGATKDQALEELNRLYRNAESEATGEVPDDSVRLVPLRKALVFLFDIVRPLLQVATVAYFFVLLIVCANVASLMLVRASERTQETALRRALGADRWRIVRQYMTEGLTLALVGGALGAVLAYFAVDVLAEAIPEDLFRVGEFALDVSALLFTLAVAVITAVVFTLKPALQSTRVGLSEAMKRSSTGSTGQRRSRRLHDFIVVAEIALTVTLLTGSSLLAQSFLYMKNLDPGFVAEGVLTFEMQLPSNEYADDEAQRRFYERLADELESLPGVSAAAAVSPLPLNFESYTQDFVPLAAGEPGEREREQAIQHIVGNNYFEAMGVELLRGRGFDQTDGADSRRVTVVNRTLSERYWPQTGAVGEVVRLMPDQEEATVVGVVEDSKSFLMNEQARPVIYVSQAQAPRSRNFMVVRTDGAPSAMVPGARAAVRRLDANLPLTNIRALTEVVDESLGPFESSAAVLGAMTIIAFILSGLGLWGVVAYTVGQSTRELAIRQALGAERGDLLKLVLRHGVALTAWGLGIGLVISVAATYFLSSLLFGVSRFDPVTFIGIVVLMALLTLAATFFPARRATRVAPAVALRDA